MKRLLFCILLFTNLCSGIAFAWDSCSEALLGDNAVVAGLVSDHQEGGAHCSDHCCHGSVHLLGIAHNHTEPPIPQPAVVFTAVNDLSQSQYIPPLLRPPLL